MPLKRFEESELPGAYELRNPPQYHFLQPFLIEAIRFAAYTVLKEMGKGVRPMYIYDCAMANGQTPSGRHPGGAHNGGINVDLGYYMTVPESAGPIIGPTRGQQLSGRPTRLDTPRQARFFAALAEIDLALQGKMVRLSAVDPQAESVIDAAILALTLPDNVEKRGVQIAYSSTGGGWGAFHHHHTHLRCNAIQADNVYAYIRKRTEQVIAEVKGGGIPPPPPEPDTPEPQPNPEPGPTITRQPDDDGQGERIVITPADEWPALGEGDTLILKDGFYGPVIFKDLPAGIVIKAENPGKAVIDASHYHGYAITVEKCAGIQLVDLAVANTEQKIKTTDSAVTISGDIKIVSSITGELDPHVH